jgi:3-oxoacid CoA-transferase subunit A
MLTTRIFALGDIHGDFKPVRAFHSHITQLVPKEDKIVLIFLGDFGGNYFFNHRDEEFKQKLGTYNMEYFVIRGNHEERPSICMENNPDAWHMEIYFGNLVYVENNYPYIKYALDHPTAYLINKHLTFVIPGAYSVDKLHRLRNGMSWFENEQLTPLEMMRGRFLAENLEKCDIILSHTCPICYEPTDLFLSQVDQSTVDKTMERYLGEIETKLDYKLWCFGHFHALRVYPEWEHHQLVMLFNQNVLDIDCYFRTNDIYQSIIKII